ncbi:DUF5365 family protein [Sutcliffiella rhizosphaerae]|uniref:Uncharacterized protein n=1 Tax=Sutcliffiella rhizosphaerae TaxID=2880967 RepID=A0ABN8A9E1_9BACI|nr:DUF5365 family protein [Sutcliffiella rhizosphaerae]CAG9621781.1 hypothetical protein BACCIP111883_02554 [Sutcliffiella rhizosphaerae]
MKVVHASTPEQEDHICELIQHLLTNILPFHFTDQEIEVTLHTGTVYDIFSNYNGTLKEAFQIISSLQTIIAVIETVQKEEIRNKHIELFKRNVNMLIDFGFTFPYALNQFKQRDMTGSFFSKFMRASNQYLV